MTTTEPYDVNFCYAAPKALESDRVKLVPFTPSLHTFSYCAVSDYYPEVYKYLPWGPFPDPENFNEFLESKIRKDPGWLLFAVFDKTKPPPEGSQDPGALAGVMGYLNSSVAKLCTEIGGVVIFPPFQGTHVSSNAVGLLLKYALNLPSDESFPGLGLRRIVWQANYLNKPSIRLGERMGFQMEGILRWDRVLPKGKPLDAGNGKGERNGDPKPGCLGRDTAILSFCWDDWENGGKEKIDVAIARIR